MGIAPQRLEGTLAHVDAADMACPAHSRNAHLRSAYTRYGSGGHDLAQPTPGPSPTPAERASDRDLHHLYRHLDADHSRHKCADHDWFGVTHDEYVIIVIIVIIVEAGRIDSGDNFQRGARLGQHSDPQRHADTHTFDHLVLGRWWLDRQQYAYYIADRLRHSYRDFFESVRHSDLASPNADEHDPATGGRLGGHWNLYHDDRE